MTAAEEIEQWLAEDCWLEVNNGTRTGLGSFHYMDPRLSVLR